MNLAVRQQILAAFNRYALLRPDTLDTLLGLTHLQTFEANVFFSQPGEPIRQEFLLLEGVVRSMVNSDSGQEHTLHFFEEGMFISPSFLRGIQGLSYLYLQTLTPVVVAGFDGAGLHALRDTCPDVVAFGNALIQADAFERAKWEALFRSQPGIEKLAYLRSRYPGLENRVAHYHIASFLGITPSSFSRLRRGAVKSE